ncbi:MAG: hypothetical protein QNJ71_11575, partial [Acidimicrobiia bacterium]|nr:hypothetical protein [Acidimicrobiia bacterium]
MEREEREEIPWSSLVAPADEGLDRRWYAVALVAAVGVLGFAGVRFVTGGGPATEPPPALAAPVTSSTVTTTTQAPAALVVSESSLTAPASQDRALAVVARAEWFVTDFFTQDGDGATDQSLAEAVVSELVDSLADLRASHEGPSTFVEWARTVRVTE